MHLYELLQCSRICICDTDRFCSVHLYELLPSSTSIYTDFTRLLLCALVRVASYGCFPGFYQDPPSALCTCTSCFLLCVPKVTATGTSALCTCTSCFFSFEIVECCPFLLLCALVRVASYVTLSIWSTSPTSALCTCTSCFNIMYSDYCKVANFCSVHLYELLPCSRGFATAFTQSSALCTCTSCFFLVNLYIDF